MIKTLEKTLANWKQNCQKNRSHSLVLFTDELLELTDKHQVSLSDICLLPKEIQAFEIRCHSYAIPNVRAHQN